jgi:hypothetical protein
VGAFSVANIEFENTTSDVDNVFGPTSPEHNENVANHHLAVADFEGIALHCAKGSPLCGGSAHAAPDKLPDEPGTIMASRPSSATNIWRRRSIIAPRSLSRISTASPFRMGQAG